jgi:hypothetical protein
MATLNDYLQQTQRMLREKKQDLINPDDLRVYINRARREVAMRTQCLRVEPNISGQVQTASVILGGTGYTAPTMSITTPDFPSGQPPTPLGAQATGTVAISGGSIVSAGITYGGSGYFQPLATITDATGSGASVSLFTSKVNTLVAGQEQFFFSAIDLSPFPGMGKVFAIRSVSVIYANYRYSLPKYSYTEYQAYIRQFPFQYQYVPTFFCQVGQGTSGYLLFYPLASQTFQVDIDCYCLPSDLINNQSFDPIPDPWTDAVPYFASHLGMLDIQNGNMARMYLELFEKQLGIYSHSANIGRANNPYGRYLLPFILGGLEMLQQAFHFFGSALS